MQKISPELWPQIVEQAKKDGCCPPIKDDPVWRKPAVLVENDGSTSLITFLPKRPYMSLSEAAFWIEGAQLCMQHGYEKEVIERGLHRFIGAIVLDADNKVLACIEAKPSHGNGSHP